MDNLIEGYTGKTLKSNRISEGNRILPATIETIKEAYFLSIPQTIKLAKELKADTFIQSCRNIYDYIVANIRYKKDTPGSKEIRTAARSWADRNTGVDCEDYSVMTAALLTNMGYTPHFEVVGFGRGFAHIYTIATHRGETVVIDCTPYMDGLGPVVPFNSRPAGIIELMEVRLLNGIPTVSGLSGLSGNTIAGIGGYLPQTPATKKLLDAQTILIEAENKGISLPQGPGQLRAIRSGIYLNGLDDQDLYLGALPFIDDVKENGNVVFKPGTDLVALGEALAVQEAWKTTGYNPKLKVADLEGIGGLSFNHDHEKASEYLNEGIGRFLKRTFNKAKQAVKKSSNFVQKAAQKTTQAVANTAKKGAQVVAQNTQKAAQVVAKGVTAFVKNPLQYINKVNPATILIRNAVLAALRINLFKMSTRLKWGYLSEAEAQKRGYNMGEFAKLKKGISTLENIFDKLGGDKANLRNAIVKGGGGIGALGEPATTATTASATPILLKIWQFLKQINFREMFGKNPSKEELEAANTTITIPEGAQMQEMINNQGQTDSETTYNRSTEMATGNRMVSTNLMRSATETQPESEENTANRLATENNTQASGESNSLLIMLGVGLAAILLFK